MIIVMIVVSFGHQQQSHHIIISRPQYFVVLLFTRSVYDKVSQICTKIFGASRTSDRQVVFTVIYRLNNWRLRLQMTQING